MKRKIAITSAIVLALLGAVMVVLYTRGADGRALASATPETVWTAVQAVPAGTPLEEARKKGLIRETMVPSKARPAGALEEISSTNASLVATSDIAPGEYLLAARFADTPTGKSAITVPEGMVSISLQLGDASKVGSFVTPGSHVAIYNTVEAPGNRNIKSTSVLLDDVLVIAVGAQPLMGQDANPAEAASGSSSTVTITVAVTPSDSVRLVHGIQTGSIYAGLRGTDAQVRQGEQINDLNVNQASGGAR